MEQKNQQHEVSEVAVGKLSYLSNQKPTLIVITGIMAAGKSTIAHLLALRFARGVHIEANVLQRMIVSGGMWVSQPSEPDGEAARQLHLRLKNMCLLGRSFFEDGFVVVLDDIIMGERWQHLQDELLGLPFFLIVLAPSVEVVTSQRDISREKTPQGHTWAAYLDHTLRSTMKDVGLWIDTSKQTPEETVEQIFQHLGLNGN